MSGCMRAIRLPVLTALAAAGAAAGSAWAGSGLSSEAVIDARECALGAAEDVHWIDARLADVEFSAGSNTWVLDTTGALGTQYILR